MEEKRVIKIKLNVLMILILIAIIIIGIIIFLKQYDFTMSNSEIMKIAEDYNYEIRDVQLRKIYNELLSDATLIVSKTSANTKNEAQRLANEYKEKINENLKNDYIVSTYESHTDFEYTDFMETEYYYKYTGAYSYKYRRTSALIEDYSDKYEFLIFKSNYFDYPYLKEYSNKEVIKQFGDILAVLNKSGKLIKSQVEDNGEIFTYKAYYISKTYRSATSGEYTFTVITGTQYSLEEAILKIDKTTGKIDLAINEDSYQGSRIYKNSYYPKMNTKVIKKFDKEGA